MLALSVFHRLLVLMMKMVLCHGKAETVTIVILLSVNRNIFAKKHCFLFLFRLAFALMLTCALAKIM